MKNIIKKTLGALLIASIFGVGLSACGLLQGGSSSGSIISSSTTNNELSEQEKIYELAVSSGYTGTYEEWLNSIKGKSVELSVQEGVICWRHQGDTDWKILISVSSLKGEDGLNGKEIELNVSPTHIQWRYVGEETYKDLISLELLKGKDGSNGSNGTDGVDGLSAYEIAVKLGFAGDELAWLESLRGKDGQNGTDGREVEFNVTPTHVQWRYVGEEEYKDLISLDTLRGKDGLNGSNGTDGEDGKDGLSAYEIAVKLGFEGDELAWLESLRGIDGNNGLSAYEIYLKYHPEYKGSEEEWINDLANGLLSTTVYTVSFDTGCDIEIENQFIKKGEKVEKPNITRPGYTLKGWKVEEEIWSFVGYPVTENIVLEAVWEPNKYCLTLYENHNDVLFEMDVFYGEEVELPSPKKDGYQFVGWYDEEGNLVEKLIYTYERDMVITANWIPLIQKFYLYNENNELIETLEFSGNGEIILPEFEMYEGWHYGDEVIIDNRINFRNVQFDCAIDFIENSYSIIYEYALYPVVKESTVTTYDGSDITINFYHTMGENLRKELDAALERFNEMYPNINVVHQSVGGYNDVRDQIKTEISVGAQPNLAYCYPDHVALYNQAKAVRTLDDYINSRLLQEDAFGHLTYLGLTDKQKADYINGYYNEGKVYGDGYMYTLPFLKSTEVLYYNKTFFEQNNLTVPTTWDEVETVARQIKEIEPSSIPLGYDSEANWFITMTEQYGYDYTKVYEDGNIEILFDNDGNKEFVKEFAGWHKEGLVTTQKLYGSYTSGLFTNLTPDEQGNLIRCLMCICSTGGASHQRPAMGDDGEYPFEVGIAPIPQVDKANPKAISQGPSVVMFKSTPQEEAASWLLLEFLTTDVEFQAGFSQVSGYMPVINSVLENTEFKSYLDSANGGDNITSLATKVAFEQREAYFSSPAFIGSSETRNQVGNIIIEAMKAAKIDQLTDKRIDEIFEIASSNCQINTPIVKDPIDGAAEYLKLLCEDEAITKENYKVESKVTYDRITYSINWDIIVDSKYKDYIMIDNVIDNNGFLTINILYDPFLNTEDIEYKLVATLFDENGNNKIVEINKVIPKFIFTSHIEYLKAEIGDDINVEGYVTAKTPRQSNGRVSMVFIETSQGEGFYIYNFTYVSEEDYNNYLGIGDYIVVSGDKGIYGGTHEIKNAKFTPVYKPKATVEPLDITAIYEAAPSLTDATLINLQGSLVTIKDVILTNYTESNGYMNFTKDGKNSYVRISPSGNCSDFDETATDTLIGNYPSKFGYKADVTGIVTQYNGSFYLMPTSKDSIKVTGTAMEPTFAIDYAKQNLTVDAEIFSNLPNIVEGFDGSTITWASTAEGVIAQDGKVTPKAEPVTTTLTATIKIGEQTATKEFKDVVVRLPDASSLSTVASAIKAANGNTPNLYVIEGVIVAKDGSNRPYIMDKDGKVMLVYNNSNDSLRNASIGSTVKLAGFGSVYNGLYQFGATGTFTVLSISETVSEINYGNPIVMTAPDFIKAVKDDKDVNMNGKYVKLTGVYLDKNASGYFNLYYKADAEATPVEIQLQAKDMKDIVCDENIGKELVVYGYSYGTNNKVARICATDINLDKYQIDTTEFKNVVAYQEEVDIAGLKIVETINGTATKIPVDKSMVTACDPTSSLGEKTLTLTYKEKTFTVKFTVKYRVNFTSGSEILYTQYVTKASEIHAPNDPYKPGYEFDGWSPEIPNAINDNITFEAEFRDTPKEIPNLATSYDAVYGDTLKDIDLPGNAYGKWEFIDSLTTPVGNVGKNTFNVQFTPKNIELTVVKSTATVYVSKMHLDFNFTKLQFDYDGLEHTPLYTLVNTKGETVEDPAITVNYTGQKGKEVGTYFYAYTINSANYEGNAMGYFDVVYVSLEEAKVYTEIEAIAYMQSTSWIEFEELHVVGVVSKVIKNSEFESWIIVFEDGFEIYSGKLATGLEVEIEVGDTVIASGKSKIFANNGDSVYAIAYDSSHGESPIIYKVFKG